MSHTSRWNVWLSLVALLALTGLTVLPVAGAQADPVAPQAVSDDEIVVIESNGRLRIDDPSVPAGVKPVVWNSGAEFGFGRVAAGDFNGDGDNELVAIRGATIKVFDPIVQPGFAPVEFTRTIDFDRPIRLVTTGDFDGDGRDEIAFVHVDYGSGIVETLQVYDGGQRGTAGEWTRVYLESFNGQWREMAAGDVNNDGGEDLALIRDPDNLLKIYSGRNWGSVLADQSFQFTWITLAMGNISNAHVGREIALSRETGAVFDSVILFRYADGALADLISGQDYRFSPAFDSMALGDLNGDGDDEVVLLRDPQWFTTSLLTLNPVGNAMRPFELSLGYGDTAWEYVAAGDTDGDSRDEVLVLRPNRYRIYTNPDQNDAFVEITGNFLVSPPLVTNVDGGGLPANPTLSVTPTTLTFDVEYGRSVAPQTVEIGNVGTAGNIRWQAQVTQGASWLRVSPATGSTPSTLTVTPDALAAGAGQRTGNIRITALDGGIENPAQDVTVTLNVRAPDFFVGPTSLSIWQPVGAAPVVRTFEIGRPGGGTGVRWAVAAVSVDSWAQALAAAGGDASALISVEGELLAPELVGLEWLNISPTEGRTSGFSSTVVRVWVDPSKLSTGLHKALIVVVTDPSVASRYYTVDLSVIVAATTRRMYLPVSIR